MEDGHESAEHVLAGGTDAIPLRRGRRLRTGRVSKEDQDAPICRSGVAHIARRKSRRQRVLRATSRTATEGAASATTRSKGTGVYGARIDGGPLAVRYRAKPVILYIFSPACHWCERNLRNANALAVATRAEYEFVGLSLTDANLEKYVRENRIGWDVGSKVPASAQEAFGMGGTPETIVVGPGGTVLHVWQGAFVGTVAADIQRAFGVRLPGLEPEASSIGD